MADALYMEDCYLKEFTSKVVSVKDGKFVVLENTAFYPNSGGQPHDLGIIKKGDEEFNVVFVGKFGRAISHEVDNPGLKPGDEVNCVIDWNRRYKFMKYHTAIHILCAVIHKETGAEITGNQIGEDKSRVDFSLENFDREQIKTFEEETNRLIAEGNPIELTVMKREEALKIPELVKLKMEISDDIEDIRVVDIKGYDMQACGGTHLKDISEVGEIEITKAQNKGKENRRVYFRLK